MMEESRGFKGGQILHKIVEEECDSAKKRIQTRINRLKDFDPSKMIDRFMSLSSLIDEEFNLAKKEILTKTAGIDKDGNLDLAFEQLKLQFMNNIPSTFLTGEEIKGEGGTSLEVALVNVSTGNVVDDVPEASSSVEIVLFHEGPNASEEFVENVPEDNMEEKKSLLVGNTHIKLRKGIGKIRSIKLKHRAKEMKSTVFRLGARFVNMVYKDRIKAAKTGPFTVQGYRKKYYKKHAKPFLRDGVYRLVNIRKDGKIAKRLRDDGIETVEDFLIRLLKDPQGLKTIVRMVPKKWRDTVANARACRDKRAYCYADFEQKTVIVFNILGEVLPQHLKTPCENHEAEAQKLLLQSAYEHWKDVNHFDDMSCLKEHLTGLHKSWEPRDLQMTDNISVDDYDQPINGAEIYFIDGSLKVGSRHWNTFCRTWRWLSACKKLHRARALN